MITHHTAAAWQATYVARVGYRRTATARSAREAWERVAGWLEDTLTTTDQDRARALSQRGAGSLSTRAGVYRVEAL